MQMKKFSDLKREIKESVGECCAVLGFEIEKSPTFYRCEGDVIKIIHIDFLSSRNAAYFNSNTASFALNLGVFFLFENSVDQRPKEYESHIRGHLLRDFKQKNPMDLKCFSLFHPERRRRDIWWVENDWTGIDELLVRAGRLIRTRAMKWLERYSDRDRVAGYLKQGRGTEVWEEGPFGLGAIGSPLRLSLIEKLDRKKG